MKNQFNTATPSSTKVVQNLPTYTDDNPSIRQYKPNLIDMIGNLLPDTGPIGVLKGLYKGTDDNLFDLLPSGNYESYSPESDLGKTLSYIADPVGAFKTGKYIVSGGTPVSRLIANSVNPESYTSKVPEIMRTLKNPKVFKEAVIEDIPQYKVRSSKMEDRLFAWRKKLGLGKPNQKYNATLSPAWRYGALKEHRESVTPIDKIWNKFGKNPDGSYYYKNPADYFYSKGAYGSGTHGLFGSYSNKLRKDVLDPKTGFYYDIDHYKDNWDFKTNRSLKDIIQNKGWREDRQTLKGNLSTLLQRYLAENLTKEVKFEGLAERLKPIPSFAKK
tara:strand:+ start:635 stop:1624 length:990 start_codon:yes stop_codon:yes gene_type:complete